MSFYKLQERGKMRFSQIKGLLLQELFITIRSYEVIFDIFVFPVMSIIVFGFLGAYLSGTANKAIGYSLVTGMLFWQIIFIVQYSVSVGSLVNIWSRNLSNMFIAPLSLTEYLVAQSFSGIVKALCIFIPASFASIAIFHINIYTLGIDNLLLFSCNLILFAISLGIIILGLIFRFGTRIQAFAWGLLPIFQPLSAAFYPVSILPKFLQDVSYFLPPTFIFEALRESAIHPNIYWNLIGVSFIENILYFIFALWFFNFMFNKSKEVGQFARLEG